VPFTPAHAAAALPLRRFHLVPSALVIGTFAPDLEYFVRLAPGGGWGHTIPGAFGLSLPMGLATLWMFHRFVKRPAMTLLPEALQRRVSPYMRPFRMGGIRRFLQIVTAMLVGIATHLVWDSFTHRNAWLFERLPFLKRGVPFPHLEYMPFYDLFQYGSSFLGLLALAWWLERWIARTRPVGEACTPKRSSGQKWRLGLWLIFVATAFAVARALWGVGIPRTIYERPEFAGQIAVTFFAVAWWELVVMGISDSAHSPGYTRAQR
jgi:hypothetical protein